MEMEKEMARRKQRKKRKGEFILIIENSLDKV
jgi:hypothetical protein